MRALKTLVMVAGCLAAGAALAAEPLSSEGFPADWTDKDFMVDELPPPEGAVVVPSPTVAASRTGVVSLPISQLPTVPADPSMTPLLTSATVQVTLTNPMPQLPVVAVDDVGKVPGDLAKLDTWGPLTELAGGLSEKAWKGISPSEVVAQIAGLEAKPLGSEALRDMVGRLLLTRMKPLDEGVVSGTLLAARATALDKLGMDEQAYALWRVVPPLARNGDSVLARGWAMSGLVAGQTTEPCGLARKLVAAGAVQPWNELSVVCTALDRTSGGLDFGLAVAADQIGFDPVLRTLLVAVRDDDLPVKLAPDDRISPLAAAVLATYPALLDEPMMSKLPSVILRRLLQTQALPLGLRLEAAELLLQRAPGAVAAESLRVLYEAQAIPPDQLVNALKVAPTLNGLATRTLLWQAMRVLPVNSDKVAAWQAFAASAKTSGRGNIPLWLSPIRAGVKPDVGADGAGLAQAVRGAWLVDDNASAKAWLDAAAAQPSPTAVLVGLRAQLAVEGAVREGKLESPALDQWLVARSLGDAQVRLAAVRTLAVLDGLGVKLPEDAWDKLDKMMVVQPDVVAGDMVRMQALEGLADAKVIGPVVMRLAAWAQARPLATWAPMEAKAAVQALITVGLKREARLLALDILTAELPPQPKPMPASKDVKGVGATPKVKIQGMKASERK